MGLKHRGETLVDRTALAISLAWLLPSICLASSFEGLGHDALPIALTDDGAQVWGDCDGSLACSDGWRWNSAEGVVEVPFKPKAVSGDGTYAVGEQSGSVIRWTTATSQVDIFASPGDFAPGCGHPEQASGGPYALGISDDGQTVMSSVDRRFLQIFPNPPPWCEVSSSVWSRTWGEDLRRLYTFSEYWLYGVHLNGVSVQTGAVAVSVVETSGPIYGTVWQSGEDWDLDAGEGLLNGWWDTEALAISGDGVAVAGSADSRAAFWPSRVADGIQYLEGEVNFPYSRATGLSDGADRVVGISSSTQGPESPGLSGAPFFWSRETGFLALPDLLTRAGIGFAGWDLDTPSDALHISGDGITLVGLGTNPDGDPEVWRVVLPSLASIPLPAQAPIVFSPFSISVGETGIISYPVEASDPNGDTLSYAMQTPAWVLSSSLGLPSLPAGFTIDPNTGLIAGPLKVAPTDLVLTTYYAEVSVSDGTLETVIEISFSAWRPRFVAPGPRFSVEGTAASFTPQVLHPGPGMSWSATGLPPGFSIDPVTGVIEGTFAEDAALDSPYSITVSMDDGQQQVTTESFEWEVLESFEVPALGPGPLVVLAALLVAFSTRRLSRVR